MKLGEKIRYLRSMEGAIRGLDRDMSQPELARALGRETGKSISQSYLSQIENGARPHLTNTTRMLLARFFKVHPGYLVDDPEGYHTELASDLSVSEDRLDLWLISGAERFRRDPDDDSRKCLRLLAAILETPQLVDRLLQVLRPEHSYAHGNGHKHSHSSGHKRRLP